MTAPDCFAQDHGLLPLPEALALIAERVEPVCGQEQLPLADCAGRVLAEPLTAVITQPPFANAAMDGFAVRAADLQAFGRRLPVAARIAAGHPHLSVLPPGTAVRIFTGAPLPAGFDTVAMQEDCAFTDGAVTVPETIAAGSHVRAAGIDFSKGDRLLAAGRRLRPQDIGLAAANGLTRLVVRRRLRVGLFSTGDELVAPGATLLPGQIYDSNRPMLAAALSALGCAVADLGPLSDDRDTLVTAFGLAALEHDVLVSSGGVSVGGEDHVRDAIQALGQIHFWKLAIKPGKPLALGHIGKAAFLGLPGNPVSSLISLLVAGRAVLHRLAGATAEADLPAPMMVACASPLPRAGNRTHFVRGRLQAIDGRPVVLPYFSQDSSLISSLVGSDGLIEIGQDGAPIETGMAVAFRSYANLLW